MADHSNHHPQQQNNQRIREQKLNSKYSLGFEREDEFDPCSHLIIIIGYCFIILTFPLLFFLYLRICRHYERAVVFRLGRLREIKGPGLFYVLPLVDRYKRVDLRLVSFQIPMQEVLSQDMIGCEIDAVVFFRVNDPVQAVVSLENIKNSTRLLSQTTLRTILGTFTIAEMLSKREQVSKRIEDAIEHVTTDWGIKIERFELKNIHLPSTLKRSLAAETEANRDSQAKLVAAEAEIRKSESLNSAAKILSNTPGALQLRYLQSLDSIGPEQKSNIVWPLPLDMMGSFCSTKNSTSFNQPIQNEFAPYREELNEENLRLKQQERQPRPEILSPPIQANKEIPLTLKSKQERRSPPMQSSIQSKKEILTPVPREQPINNIMTTSNHLPQRSPTPPVPLKNMFVGPRYYSDIKPSLTSPPPTSPTLSTAHPDDEEEEVHQSHIVNRYQPQNGRPWSKDNFT